MSSVERAAAEERMLTTLHVQDKYVWLPQQERSAEQPLIWKDATRS